MKARGVVKKIISKSSFVFFLIIFFTTPLAYTNTNPICFKYYSDDNVFPKCEGKKGDEIHDDFDCVIIGNQFHCWDNKSPANVCGFEGKSINDFILTGNSLCNSPTKCKDQNIFLENNTSTNTADRFTLFCDRDANGVGRVKKCNYYNGDPNIDATVDYPYFEGNQAGCSLLEDALPNAPTGPDCSPKNLVNINVDVDGDNIKDFQSYSPQPSINRLIPEAFNSLESVRSKIIQEAGNQYKDLFAIMGEVLRSPGYTTTNEGVSRTSWHKAGRAIDINQSYGEIVRNGSKEAYNRGVKIIARPEGKMFRLFVKNYNSEGEEVDITKIFEENGWYRINAYENLTTGTYVPEWWHYQYHPDSISWENAMFQVWGNPTESVNLSSLFPEIDWVDVATSCRTGNFLGSSMTCSLTGNFILDSKPKQTDLSDFSCSFPNDCSARNLYSQETTLNNANSIFCIQEGPNENEGQKYLCPRNTPTNRNGEFTILNSYNKVLAPSISIYASPYLSEIPPSYINTNLKYCRKLSELYKQIILSRDTQDPQSVTYFGIIRGVVDVLYYGSLFMFLFIMVLNGIRYVNANENSNKLSQAKKGFFNAVAGLLFIIFAGGFLINLIKFYEGI
jgi:hypothetical protein